MNATHTSGPWSLNLPCFDEVVADFGGNDISIAQAIRNPADACLIAAAPELRQALEDLLWAVSGFGDFEDQYPEEAAAARAALAKAEGNR